MNLTLIVSYCIDIYNSFHQFRMLLIIKYISEHVLDPGEILIDQLALDGNLNLGLRLTSLVPRPLLTLASKAALHKSSKTKRRLSV